MSSTSLLAAALLVCGLLLPVASANPMYQDITVVVEAGAEDEYFLPDLKAWEEIRLYWEVGLPQPPTVVCKMEAWNMLQYVHIAYRYAFPRLVPICKLSRCLLTKLLHWSTVGSLLRVLLVG